jgi:hypothetical protein
MFSTSVNDEKAASEQAGVLPGEHARAYALRGGHTGQHNFMK